MGRGELTLKNVNEINHEPSRSILHLIEEYQDKEFQGKKGLCQMQFRYALMKEYATEKQIKEDLQVCLNVKSLKKFFGSSLEYLIKSGKIIPGCINSPQHLSYFLPIMKNIGAIELKGKKQKRRYMINEKFEKFEAQRKNITLIEQHSSDDFVVVPSETDFSLQSILYGMSENVFKEKKQIISKYLDEINERIMKIDSLTKEKTNKKLDDKIIQFKSQTTSKNISYFLDEERSNLFRIFDFKTTRSLVDTTLDKFVEQINEALEIFSIHKDWIGNRSSLPSDTPSMKSIRGIYQNIVKNYRIAPTFSSTIKLSLLLVKFFEIPEMSNSDIKYFTSKWSEKYFTKDYNFTLSEIKEILLFLEKNINSFLSTSTPLIFSGYANCP